MHRFTKMCFVFNRSHLPKRIFSTRQNPSCSAGENLFQARSYRATFRHRRSLPVSPDCQPNIFIQSVLLCGIFSTLQNLLVHQDDEKELSIIIMIKRGILLHQSKKYHAAEQVLHVALKLAQEEGNLQAQTYIYDVLGNIALEQGKYQKAEILFKDVLSRALSLGTFEELDNEVVAISLKLASIYAALGKDELAQQGLDFCISTQIGKEKKIPENSLANMTQEERDTGMLLSKSYNQLAKYLQSKYKFTSAKDAFAKALHYAIRYNGPDHPQTLVLRNDLATAYADLGLWEESIGELREAVREGAATGHGDIAAFELNLGMALAGKESFSEGRVSCRSAEQRVKHQLNSLTAEDDPEVKKELGELLKRIDFCIKTCESGGNPEGSRSSQPKPKGAIKSQ